MEDKKKIEDKDLNLVNGAGEPEDFDDFRTQGLDSLDKRKHNDDNWAFSILHQDMKSHNNSNNEEENN